MILVVFAGFGASSERGFVSIFLDVVSTAFTLENITVDQTTPIVNSKEMARIVMMLIHFRGRRINKVIFHI